jgi:cephalosporin hydroxylase
MSDLWQHYQNNTGKVIDKWHHYFPIYERHFAPWRNKTVTFLEIGVQHGGSLQMWKNYFGPASTIIGVDIESRCAGHDRPDNGIFMRIGDATKPDFVQSIVDEFGEIDCVLDDGSHTNEDIASSFNMLYDTLSKNGVYVIEDIGFNLQHSPLSVANFSLLPMLQFQRPMEETTTGVSFYNSVMAFDRGNMPNRRLQIGTEVIYTEETWIGPNGIPRE